jgi:hypothetical protein
VPLTQAQADLVKAGDTLRYDDAVLPPRIVNVNGNDGETICADDNAVQCVLDWDASVYHNLSLP